VARISENELNNLKHLIELNPQEALSLLLTYEKDFADDVNLIENRGAFLIDIGSALGDMAIVQRGIDSIQQLLSPIDDHTRLRFSYNLGNGYSALHNISRCQSTYCFDPDHTPLIQAKRFYRETLQGQGRLDASLRAQVHINYGNCLSGLGRSLEAISEYDTALSYAPDHPMAWGNLGIELNHFAFIAGDLAVFQDAHAALGRALAGSQLEQTGHSLARPYFENPRQEMESLLNKMKGRSTPGMDKMPVISTPYHQAYADHCAKHFLFLNFSLKIRPSPHSFEDTVGFSLITGIQDNVTFPRLARVVNDIKEKYATARWLLFLAKKPPLDFLQIDELTRYVDNLDYAVYGIQPGMLKTAFESAYNVLDKIAVFLNDYLNLGMKEHQVHFTKVWRKSGTTRIRENMRDLGSCHLFGLYDISRDLDRGGYLEYLRTTRNLSTHCYLVPHSEGFSWREDADGAEYHMEYRDLFDRVTELLRLVRSAVIYLIAFIADEERRRHPNREGIPPVPVFVYQPYPIDPRH